MTVSHFARPDSQLVRPSIELQHGPRGEVPLLPERSQRVPRRTKSVHARGRPTNALPAAYTHRETRKTPEAVPLPERKDGVLGIEDNRPPPLKLFETGGNEILRQRKRTASDPHHGLPKIGWRPSLPPGGGSRRSRPSGSCPVTCAPDPAVFRAYAPTRRAAPPRSRRRAARSRSRRPGRRPCRARSERRAERRRWRARR